MSERDDMSDFIVDDDDVARLEEKEEAGDDDKDEQEFMSEEEEEEENVDHLLDEDEDTRALFSSEDENDSMGSLKDFIVDDNEDVEEEAQMEEENSEEEFIDEEDSDEDASDEEAWETGRIPVGFQVNRVAPRRSGRNRRAPQRYKDEHYAELILEDIPSSDIDDILNDSSE